MSGELNEMDMKNDRNENKFDKCRSLGKQILIDEQQSLQSPTNEFQQDSVPSPSSIQSDFHLPIQQKMITRRRPATRERSSQYYSKESVDSSTRDGDDTNSENVPKGNKHFDDFVGKIRESMEPKERSDNGDREEIGPEKWKFKSSQNSGNIERSKLHSGNAEKSDDAHEKSKSVQLDKNKSIRSINEILWAVHPNSNENYWTINDEQTTRPSQSNDREKTPELYNAMNARSKKFYGIGPFSPVYRTCCSDEGFYSPSPRSEIFSPEYASDGKVVRTTSKQSHVEFGSQPVTGEMIM